MSHTFIKGSLGKKGFRGFTLIELLVVISIIGLLSTVIAAPITQARKKGRDGKKIADIRQIVNALQQYADDNAGLYPNDLTSLVPNYLANLPGAATATATAKDKYMYVPYIENSKNIGFHLGVKLEAPNPALGDDRDCHGSGTISSTNQWCIDTNAGSGTTQITAGVGNAGATGFANGDLPTGTTALTNDFKGGTESATTACTGVTTGVTACVYDVTN